MTPGKTKRTTQRDADNIAMGNAIRVAITLAGLKISDTAPLIPLGVNSLSRRVNGDLPFTWPEIVAVSRITGVAIDEIVATAGRISDNRSAA